MPVTFEGVSEYRRNFVVPQTVSDHTHSPPAPRLAHGPATASTPMALVARGSQPHPQQDHVIIAGLSSAKMAVTQEPAFARKRKPLDHGKKVTFTTDYAEHGSPTKEDDKAMRFRAGFRRNDINPTPTEYNLQYIWKDPAPDHTPLLQAENLLNRQTHPSNYGTGQQQPHDNGHRQNGGIRDDDDENIRNGEDFEQQESHDNSLQGDAIDGADGLSRLSGQKESAKVPKLQLASDTNSPKGANSKNVHCSRKATKKKPKSHHYHASHHGPTSKKRKGGHSKAFMSEYKRQYKVWPISPSTSEAKRTDGDETKKTGKKVAGSPQVLTDTSDPRLLKHKPLPAHMPIARWGSEYSANFMSPTDFDYERGVWKGAPHPELYMKVEGKPQVPAASGQPSQPHQSDSWFDQLVELRQRADEYRTRSQRVHFPPYHISGHHHDVDRDSSVATSSTTSPSDDQTETEISSPTSNSAGGDFDDQNVRLSQNQGPIGAGRPQVRGKKPPLKTQLFTKAAAPLTKDVSGEGVRIGDGHPRMKIEDVEDSWDSETFTEDSSSSQDGGKFHSSTPPQDDHLKARGSFKEPTAEMGRLKSVPRPNAFSIGDGEVEGRVPTPELRKSIPGQQSRHHLDITTPAGGGLLISPTKPEVGGDRGVTKPVELPYPPLSPKYRHDMRSKVLIYPPPPPEVGNDRQKAAAPVVSSTTNEAPPRSVSDNLGPRSVPASSSSPYHAHCLPRPPNIPPSKPTHNLTHAPLSHPSHIHKSHHHQASQQAHVKSAATSVAQPRASTKPQTLYSGPVRKLLFESHGKRPSSQQHCAQQSQHVTKKSSSNGSSSLYRSHTKTTASKSSHSNVKSCETCGSHLRSPAVLGGGVGALGAGHSRKAPPTNLSRLHSDRDNELQAYRQQSQLKLNEIRSKLASHSTESRYHGAAPTNLDDYRLPDSGLGSSNRGREGGQRSNGLAGRRARDVDELSLSSLSLSSCSVASDVLQKARERRDRFWLQSSHITAS